MTIAERDNKNSQKCLSFEETRYSAEYTINEKERIAKERNYVCTPEKLWKATSRQDTERCETEQYATVTARHNDNDGEAM